MGRINNVFKYRDDRDTLIQLRHELDDLENVFQKEIADLKPRTLEYQERVSEFFAAMDLLNAEIAKIETEAMRRRSRRWKIPLPQRPKKDGEQSEFWDWHHVHNRYYISEKGMSHLRKEIYQEWEMFMKPWLSWAAIAISVISLVVAVLKP